MENKMLDLQKRMLTDANARREFAANPTAFLQKEGVSIPEAVKLPASIPLEAFEAQVAQTRDRLTQRGVDIENLDLTQLGKGLLTESELEAVAGGAASGELMTAAAAVLVVVAAAVWTWVVL